MRRRAFLGWLARLPVVVALAPVVARLPVVRRFRWAMDAPTGAFASHALARSLRQEAMKDSMFVRLLDQAPHAGRAITITRVKRIGNP